VADPASNTITESVGREFMEGFRVLYRSDVGKSQNFPTRFFSEIKFIHVSDHLTRREIEWARPARMAKR
jgi:hypothetical protein